MTSQSDMFYELLNKMRIVHDNKRHDYATKEDIFKNFRTSELAGIPAWQGVAIRIGDKFSRLMANYALICHILFYEMRRKQSDEYKDKLTEDFLNKRQYEKKIDHGNDISYENEVKK